MTARTRAVGLPEESAIAALYQGADLADSFAITLPPGVTTNVESLARTLFARPPFWLRTLLAARDAAVSVIGLKTTAQLGANPDDPAGRVEFFKIYAIHETEIILGEDDKHLDFRASVLRRADDLIITTVVHCHNFIGRSYLKVILPFHRKVVRSALSRAARRGWPA